MGITVTFGRFNWNGRLICFYFDSLIACYWVGLLKILQLHLLFQITILSLFLLSLQKRHPQFRLTHFRSFGWQFNRTALNLVCGLSENQFRLGLPRIELVQRIGLLQKRVCPHILIGLGHLISLYFNSLSNIFFCVILAQISIFWICENWIRVLLIRSLICQSLTHSILWILVISMFLNRTIQITFAYRR